MFPGADLDDVLGKLTALITQLRADVDELRGLEQPQISYGTWTPTLNGATTAGVFTYSTQVGHWVRVGDMVDLWFRFVLTGIITPPVGNIRIAGIPFAAGNYSNSFSQQTLVWGNVDLSAGSLGIRGYTIPTQSLITLVETFDNATAAGLPAAAILTNSTMFGSGRYRA